MAARTGEDARLRLLCSPSVVGALRSAAHLQELPADVRAEAARCAEGADVPWRLLRRVCRALRQANREAGSEDAPGAEPWLQTLARSGGLQLLTPQSRPRSVELERRVKQLRNQAEERAYQSLVRDVTRSERDERERVPMSSAMQELGYGMHVITLMAACFLGGYAVGRRLFDNHGAQVITGALGMLACLLVETALFVIRDTHASRAKQE